MWQVLSRFRLHANRLPHSCSADCTSFSYEGKEACPINIYDRRNIFYVDVFTLERRDQLPFAPSVGLKVAFE